MDSIISTKQIEQAVNTILRQALASMDLAEIVRTTASEIIEKRLTSLSFPEASISPAALNWTDYKISGDIISGGIQTEFSSQGIDDQATSCKLTIMDEYVVVETGLVASSLDVKHDFLAEGNITLSGEISTESHGLKNFVEHAVEHRLRKLDFPDNSIAVSALRWGNSTITGDQIVGGIHREFSSLGIEDQATECRLTVMDEFVVIENTLVANSIEIKQDLIVEGNIILHGEVDNESAGFKKIVEQAVAGAKSALTDEIKVEYAASTAENLRENGIDLKKITIDNNVVLDGNSLGKFVVTSNLQRVGQLKELQVRGETYLADTLYVSNSRIGINTMEPARALSVWEEECELVMGKHERQTGYIGSIRNQKVVLGSDSQTNILLDVDGSTRIYDLYVGQTKLQSSDTMPNHAGQRGEVVFNTDPAVGKPFGWMCLGEARWACMPALTD